MKRKIIKYILLIIGIIYIISPIDFIPDFFLPFGLGDDLIVLLIIIKEILSLLTGTKSININSLKAKQMVHNPKIVDAEIVE